MDFPPSIEHSPNTKLAVSRDRSPRSTHQCEHHLPYTGARRRWRRGVRRIARIESMDAMLGSPLPRLTPARRTQEGMPGGTFGRERRRLERSRRRVREIRRCASQVHGAPSLAIRFGLPRSAPQPSRCPADIALPFERLCRDKRQHHDVRIRRHRPRRARSVAEWLFVAVGCHHFLVPSRSRLSRGSAADARGMTSHGARTQPTDILRLDSERDGLLARN
jgi:hypothetical protein